MPIDTASPGGLAARAARALDAVRALRARVRRLPGGALAWRIGVAVVGLAIIAVGVVLLPLPGPGWLIIFVGLGVWGTEFAWARRLLRFARKQVARWTAWISIQPRWLQLAVGLALLIVCVAAGLFAWWLSRLI